MHHIVIGCSVYSLSVLLNLISSIDLVNTSSNSSGQQETRATSLTGLFLEGGAHFLQAEGNSVSLNLQR